MEIKDPEALLTRELRRTDAADYMQRRAVAFFCKYRVK